MKTTRTLESLRTIRAGLKGPLGLVPTMGYLHEGHLSLVKKAQKECASLAASIFVNPTQFGPSEDLESYPRDLKRDFALLEAEGVDLVWVPEEEDMYPPDFQTWVSVEDLTRRLEGENRPGHFRGVTTVVTKLFNAFQPDKAYFGQKDAQQAIVIQRMVQDLNFPIEIVICPTVRERDGLAMSSRNNYLNEREREAATILFRALTAAERAFEEGERDASVLRKQMLTVLDTEPMAQTQYVSIADLETLDEIEASFSQALLSMAVFVGNTRLIDNVVLREEGQGIR